DECEHDVLVAAEASDHGVVGACRSQCRRDPTQDGVARQVTVLTVDRREVVDVDERDAETGDTGAGTGGQRRQASVDRPAVADAGQRVDMQRGDTRMSTYAGTLA